MDGISTIVAALIIGISFIIMASSIAGAIYRSSEIKRSENNKLVDKMSAVIMRFADVYSEWVEYQATNEPRPSANNKKSSPEATVRKSVSDKIGSTMEGSKVEEGYFSKVSKNVETAVQFGEDVSG